MSSCSLNFDPWTRSRMTKTIAKDGEMSSAGIIELFGLGRESTWRTEGYIYEVLQDK
jgi:hypothetical protein